MKIEKFLLFAALSFAFGATSHAGGYLASSQQITRGGGTDKCGCHYNKKTGEYHCHKRKKRGGDCPD